MNRESLLNYQFLRKIGYIFSIPRAIVITKRIEQYLNDDGKILDIGAGTCNVFKILVERGYKVTPMDIKNWSLVEGINPIIYDGNHLPFNRDKFEVTLILFVLHHSLDPENLLGEASRVSKRIIVWEALYTSKTNETITHIFDSLITLNFKEHPHNNKNDKEWRLLFKQLGLKLKDVKYYRFLTTKQVLYYLEK